MFLQEKYLSLNIRTPKMRILISEYSSSQIKNINKDECKLPKVTCIFFDFRKNENLLFA